jgi:hypothetical protein
MKELTERFFVAQFGSELPIWAKSAVAMANILVILAIAWVFMSFSSRLLRALNRRVVSQQPDQEERKRLDTLIRVVRYIASVVIGAITFQLRQSSQRQVSRVSRWVLALRASLKIISPVL